MEDVEIIKRIVAAEAVKRVETEYEFVVGGTTYKLEAREFEPGFSIFVPESFENMAIEYAKLKYPYEDRPSIILTSADTIVNIAFERTGVQGDTIESRLPKYRAWVKKINPNYVFFSENINESEYGLKIASFDYSGNAADGDVYYLSFFTDLPDGELFGWFSCPSHMQANWEPIARRMIKTLKPLMSEV